MNNDQSPFHLGEQMIQTKLGVRENMERFGRMVIRDHMPEQHQRFYQQLPFIFLGHEDPKGFPWASILFAKPGFIKSDTEHSLSFSQLPLEQDPLTETLNENSLNGKNTKLGILGIELPTRRRNRLAAHVTKLSDNSIELNVDQTFGNCPQYIQSREYYPPDSHNPTETSRLEIRSFDNVAQKIVESADTFFIASSYDSGNNNPSDGADVSHRGGKPGFVKIINNNQLIIPDYMGNNHFNTFGNIELNGKAGLLFIDFQTGDILTLTGEARVDWESDDIAFFEGAQRLLRFKLTKGYLIKKAIPANWSKPEFSPNTQLTGTWDEAKKLKEIETQRNQWLPYRVDQIVIESESIRSFHLVPENGQLFKFKPGQFLTIRVRINDEYMIRTYTVSNADSDGVYRLSIKREHASSSNVPDGIVSNHMHSNVKLGDIIEAKAPTGNFYFETRKQKPALLVAAGIGITPMLAMLRQALVDAVKTRYIRPTTLVAIVRTEKERAFYQELSQVAEQSSGQINIHWCITKPQSKRFLGSDFNFIGRPTKEFFQAVIENKRTDAYLCGPPPFMQQTYDTLRMIGLSDLAIYAESFGPSSLKRDSQTQAFKFAKNASIIVQDEQGEVSIEQQWSDKDGTLLEFLESHGVQPEYGCRSGQCGSCKAKLINGKVSSTLSSTAPVDDSEVLLCCAKPTATKETSMPTLTIQFFNEHE
ncbi:MAG: FAD-binding oxidoreductase [Kangiellaceae bacterium]|jgi:uncharacterized protein